MIRLPLGILRPPGPPLPPSDDLLRRLGERVLSAVRDGGRLAYPETSVQTAALADTIGGSREWEELVTPLRQLPPFVWPS